MIFRTQAKAIAKIFFVAILFQVFQGCGIPTTVSQTKNDPIHKKVKLGLNDVAILIPFLSNHEFLDNAVAFSERPNPNFYAPGQPAAPLDGQSFVPNSVMLKIRDSILAQNISHDAQSVAPHVGSGQNYFDFRMVSIRLDPCANLLDVGDDFSACRREFRLVWQARAAFRAFEDNNIHTIYELDQQEFSDVVATMRALKAATKTDTLALPLMAQPNIAEEGPKSAYLAGVIGLVHRYARASKLREVAYLANTSITGWSWPMLKLGVKGSVITLLPLTNVIKGEGEQDPFIQRFSVGTGRLSDPFPLSNTADSVFENVPPQTLWDRSSRLENPILHGTSDLDCASCHSALFMTEEARKTAKNQGIVLKNPEDAFKSSRWDLKQVYNGDVKGSLQIFSYFKDSVKVAQRVINEAAVSADFINDNYL